MNLSLLLSFLLAFTSCSDDETATDDGLRRIEKQVTKIAKSGNLPSLEVTVQTQEDVLTFSYHNEQVTPQTTFGIGSTTKLLAATLVIRKIEMGELSLSDKITEYIAPEQIDFIDGVENVTVKNLLNHTSGIADYTKHGDWGSAVVAGNAPRTFEEKLQYINPASARMGSFNYSNSNYLLLQKIIESVDGKTFDQSFNDFYAAQGLNIILNATKTGLESYFAQSANASMNVSGWNEHYGFDGGAYANTNDMNSFLRKLFIEKTMLSSNSLTVLEDWVSMDDMTIPIGAGSLHEYGHGLMKLKFEDDMYIGHSGGTLRYQSFVFFNPQNNVTISVLTNCSGQHYNNVFFQEVIPAILNEL